MNDTNAATSLSFDELESTLLRAGTTAMLRQLAQHLETEGTPREWLEAQLLEARVELGLPALVSGPLDKMPEAIRAAYEDRYVAALRRVGSRLLAAGEIAAAWPYFRIIGEKEAIASALEGWVPGEGRDDLSTLIDVAFQQGAHPRKGFEWIVEHYGVCSAITAFEQLPPEEPLRAACAGRLVVALHGQLAANVRADIAKHEGAAPPLEDSLTAMMEGREWLHADDNYHVDLSHLAAVVRLSPLLSDPAEVGLAIELTDYGRRLSSRHRYEGEPPFQDLYNDHRLYLEALSGHEVEAAIDHFRARLAPSDPDDPISASFPAQILVRLLERVGYLDEAVEVASIYLAAVPEGALSCSSMAALCQRAGLLDRLAESARRRGDLVQYAVARVESCSRSIGSGSKSDKEGT